MRAAIEPQSGYDSLMAQLDIADPSFSGSGDLRWQEYFHEIYNKPRIDSSRYNPPISIILQDETMMMKSIVQTFQ